MFNNAANAENTYQQKMTALYIQNFYPNIGQQTIVRCVLMFSKLETFHMFFAFKGYICLWLHCGIWLFNLFSEYQLWETGVKAEEALLKKKLGAAEKLNAN